MTAFAPCLFVIGTARSGTTALYEVLTSHPDSTWLSNYSQRVPPLGLVHPRGTDAGKHRARRPWTTRPVEGYRTFDRALRPGADGRLEARSALRLRALQLEVGLHRRRLGRDGAPVFVSKNTRNTRGIRVLERAFPGSRYLHLVRHPVPTVASLLRVDFLDTLRTGWRPRSQTFAEAVADGTDPTRLAAELWAWETAIALDDLAEVATARVLRIRYEDLVRAPEAVLHTVGEFGGLPPERHPSFAARARELARAPVATAPESHLVEVVADACGETARRAGYVEREPPA